MRIREKLDRYYALAPTDYPHRHRFALERSSDWPSAFDLSFELGRLDLSEGPHLSIRFFRVASLRLSDDWNIDDQVMFEIDSIASRQLEAFHYSVTDSAHAIRFICADFDAAIE